MYRLPAVLLLVLGVKDPTGAEAEDLQVAGLYRFDGPLGAGSGELVIDRLGRDHRRPPSRPWWAGNADVADRSNLDGSTLRE